MDYLQASVTSTDHHMDIIIYLMSALYLVILILILQVFSIRLLIAIREKHKQTALSIWRPILAITSLEMPAEIPALHPRHSCTLLNEWNQFHLFMRGNATDHLNRLAIKLKLDYKALKMLKSRDITQQMLAIITLGNMRAFSAWDYLIHILDHKNPTLALVSAKALLQIDSKHSIPYILPLIIHHKEWPEAHVSSTLRTAEPMLLCQILSEALSTASIDELPHILNLTGSTHCEEICRSIDKILQTATDEEVIAACLQAVQSPTAIAHVRRLCHHKQGFIRVHAARALGRIGREQDKKLLIELLTDPEWWVRYRSAQALLAMPFIPIEELKEMRNQFKDKFARDILTQALEEKRLND